MLNVNLNDDVVINLDMEHPITGVGDGAVELKNGDSSMTVKFNAVCETDTKLSADAIRTATEKALMDSGYTLKVGKVFLPM